MFTLVKQHYHRLFCATALFMLAAVLSGCVAPSDDASAKSAVYFQLTTPEANSETIFALNHMNVSAAYLNGKGNDNISVMVELTPSAATQLMALTQNNIGSPLTFYTRDT
ncbi:hypothetical protein [Shewanella surugensis]|uniref:Uncharacterized protein n=1 Tax=Shewanella surugensis TaxID=212020 RepID=A0ABT0L9D1_9GAMM|nr:hypothetical protein [Shewanella surugensis]MCL1124289.1 hypothetical protein [Shewanella surugensis]